MLEPARAPRPRCGREVAGFAEELKASEARLEAVRAELDAIALALPNLAYCARLTRAALIEVLGSDYIRAARGRGIAGARLLFFHVLRPGLLPVVAWLSPALINVASGSAIVEQVFGIPGIGRYFVQGALNRDYTLVLGVVLVIGVAIVVINVAVDAVRGWMDPRLRES